MMRQPNNQRFGRYLLLVMVLAGLLLCLGCADGGGSEIGNPDVDYTIGESDLGSDVDGSNGGSNPALEATCIEGRDAQSEAVTIRNATASDISFTITTNADWLNVIPASGTLVSGDQTFTVTYASAALSAGTYYSVIQVANSANDDILLEIQVVLTVNADNVAEGALTFATDEALETYLKGQFAASILPEAVYFSDDVGSMPVENDTSTDGAGSQEGHSATNIQESGVDEGDKVKTDGARMYVADGNRVHIVAIGDDGRPGPIGHVDVKGVIDSLYLYGHILVAIYRPTASAEPCACEMAVDSMIGWPGWIMPKSKSGVLLVDVSDPSTPRRLYEIVVDGALVSSRLTQGRLHVIQQFLPVLPTLDLVYAATEQDRADTIAANFDLLDTVSLDDLVPGYSLLDAQGDVIESGRLVASDHFFRPEEPDGGSIVTILTLDLDDLGQGFSSSGILADAHTVYASTQSLYLAANRWRYWYFVDSLSQMQTSVYKFSLSDTHAVFQGSGRVNGTILNQFSMGEHEDVLRVATTTGTTWDGSSRNHVFCLKSNDTASRLEVIGRLENLAPGESLYAARFIGTRGFLVTFVNVDPLFTLDLSDPRNPKAVGELKVPGYSDYIHPWGRDHLITVGKDTLLADGFPWYQGLQLSIFDISDFSDPKLLHKELIGDRGTGSEALYDHKAFTFWAENNLLALPVDLRELVDSPEYPWSYGERTFAGLYVYRFSVEGGFEFLGRISTTTSDAYDYCADWTRGIFIDKWVYAVNAEQVGSAETDAIAGTIQVYPLSD